MFLGVDTVKYVSYKTYHIRLLLFNIVLHNQV